MEDRHEQYAKHYKRRVDVPEKDATRCINDEANDAADLNEDKLIDTEEGIKVVGTSSSSCSFHEKMKRLSLHRRPSRAG